MKKYIVESNAGEATVEANTHIEALAKALPGYQQTSCTAVGNSRYYVDDHNHVVAVSEFSNADAVSADMEALVS